MCFWKVKNNLEQTLMKIRNEINYNIKHNLEKMRHEILLFKSINVFLINYNVS